MSEKRTKSDKSQRQADKLEKKARHPGAKKKKRPVAKIHSSNSSKHDGAHRKFPLATAT